jgi:SAM-dependent methyltransferase
MGHLGRTGIAGGHALGDLAGKDAIELGCGTAYVSAWLARRGARVVGIDNSEAQLATARDLQRKHGLNSRCSTAMLKLFPTLTRASISRSANTARACGLIRNTGFPKPPACCGPADALCSW